MAEPQEFDARRVVDEIYAHPAQLVALLEQIHEVMVMFGYEDTLETFSADFSLMARDILVPRGPYKGFVEQ